MLMLPNTEMPRNTQTSHSYIFYKDAALKLTYPPQLLQIVSVVALYTFDAIKMVVVYTKMVEHNGFCWFYIIKLYTLYNKIV